MAHGMIETTMVPKQANVLYEQLLFGATPSDKGYGNGGVGGQEGYEPACALGVADAPVGQRNFNRVLGPIKMVLAGARAKYPAL